MSRSVVIGALLGLTMPAIGYGFWATMLAISLVVIAANIADIIFDQSI